MADAPDREVVSSPDSPPIDDADQLHADRELIKQIRSHFKDNNSFWARTHQEAVQDMRFYHGMHYDEAKERLALASGSGPVHQVNQLHTMVQQVENSIRQQHIGINVHATDEQGSEETAAIYQGLIRHIENLSNADQAYIWAVGIHGALVPGFGFMKLETRYVSNTSFDQDIYICGVKDPFKILPDFRAIKPDFSDSRFWFEIEVLSKEEYRELYSNSEAASVVYSDWSSMGNAVGTDWFKQDSVVVARYWYKETATRHLALFEDGTTGFLDDYGVHLDEQGNLVVHDEEAHTNHPRVMLSPEEKAELLAVEQVKKDTSSPENEKFPVTETMIPETRLADVLKYRAVTEEKVFWVDTNGHEILNRGEWADTEFPFVGVCGHDEILDGERKIYGVIRQAIDSQKMYDYMTTQLVRRIDASNKSPWIIAEEAVREPHRKFWEQSHRVPKAVLWYRSRDDMGQTLNPPRRGDAVEPAVQGFLEAAAKFNDDIKKTVGITDAVLGLTAGERQSGQAIKTLAQKGENSNFHFNDNFVMSIKRLGTLILRLIPKIYDTARTVRIIKPDESAELVKINQIFTKNGRSMSYDIASGGNYEVVIDLGPSYATKQAEESQEMLEYAAINPQIMPAIADVIAENFDWKGKNKLVSRIRQVQGATMPFLNTSDDMDALPPAAKAIIGRMQGQLQHTQAQLNQIGQENQQLKFEKQANVVAHASKERVAQFQAIAGLDKERMRLAGELVKQRSEAQREILKAQLDHIQHSQQLHFEVMQHLDQLAQLQNDPLTQAAQKMISSGGQPSLPASGPAPSGQPGAGVPLAPLTNTGPAVFNPMAPPVALGANTPGP